MIIILKSRLFQNLLLAIYMLANTVVSVKLRYQPSYKLNVCFERHLWPRSIAGSDTTFIWIPTQTLLNNYIYYYFIINLI